MTVVAGAAVTVERRARPSEDELLDACSIVPVAALEALDISGARRPFIPDGQVAGSTGCSLGDDERGVTAAVFAHSTGGRDTVDRQQKVFAERGIEVQEISVPKARAFSTGGPRNASANVVVLRGDRYVNVIVYEAPPGAAEHLARAVASSLR